MHAVVVVEDGREVSAQELAAHCRKRIAGYKVPRSIERQHEPLPKSGAGKVLKDVLRKPFLGRSGAGRLMGVDPPRQLGRPVLD